MGPRRKELFYYIVVFILGVLLAGNAFTVWQYSQLQKELSVQRQDITTIIQAYNNLVTELQDQGLGQ